VVPGAGKGRPGRAPCRFTLCRGRRRNSASWALPAGHPRPRCPGSAASSFSQHASPPKLQHPGPGSTGLPPPPGRSSQPSDRGSLPRPALLSPAACLCLERVAEPLFFFSPPGRGGGRCPPPAAARAEMRTLGLADLLVHLRDPFADRRRTPHAARTLPAAPSPPPRQTSCRPTVPPAPGAVRVHKNLGPWAQDDPAARARAVRLPRISGSSRSTDPPAEITDRAELRIHSRFPLGPPAPGADGSVMGTPHLVAGKQPDSQNNLPRWREPLPYVFAHPHKPGQVAAAGPTETRFGVARSPSPAVIVDVSGPGPKPRRPGRQPLTGAAGPSPGGRHDQRGHQVFPCPGTWPAIPRFRITASGIFQASRLRVAYKTPRRVDRETG